MKKKFTTLLLFTIFFLGLCLLLYPSVSNYWNSFTQSRAIASYAEEVALMEQEEQDRIINEALAYNAKLQSLGNRFSLPDEMVEEYQSALDLTGTGIMGYIEIPIIRVTIPIYHGTEDSVLQTAIGHVDWSSLPVGGPGSHCVVSGHRGLPSAKLFTDLDKLIEGDVFMFRILNEVLTYQVDKISIVFPHEVNELVFFEGEDYCTLTTCTPYGINSHRLLVRGKRIENIDDGSSIRITSDAMIIEPMVVAPITLIPILFIGMVILIMSDKKKPEDDDGGTFE